MAEPRNMEALEQAAFAEVSHKNYKRWIIPLVEDILKYRNGSLEKLLDVASGPGLLTKELGKRLSKAQIFGIDTSISALKIAKKNCQKLTNVKFLRANAARIPFADDFFDVVVCKDSLHHFHNLRTTINEMLRVTKQNGLIYLQDLRRDMPDRLIMEAVPADTIFKKLQYYSARAAYTKDEIKKILAGLKIKKYRVASRTLTTRLREKYKKIGIDTKMLKTSFDSRYIVIVHK